MSTSRLKDKKILVTGASKGLGMYTAIHLAREGAVPILVARSEARLELIRTYIEEAFGVRCPIYKADLASESSREELLAMLRKEHASLAGLVNNAGVGSFEMLRDTSWEKTRKMIELNITGLVHLTHGLYPLLEKNEGHLVNIASQSGKIATPKASVYTATKHAVVGFTNALRMESDAVSVTGVNLGPVATSFFEEADPGGTYEKAMENILLDANTVAYKIVDTFTHYKREINAPVWMEGASRLYQLNPSLMEKAFRSQFHKK